MRLYTIEINGQKEVMLEHNNGKLYKVNDFGFSFADMNDLIDNVTETQMLQLKNIQGLEESISGKNGYDFNEVKICAPIPVPKQDIVCLGANYRDHAEECKDVIDLANKKATIYFSKRVNEAIGVGDKIPHYDFVEGLDYEVELGVVLGKDTKNVKAENAGDYIFGYTIINDVSARNLQKRHQQWYIGKSLDGYTAMGPCIVTADEIDDVQDLDVSCKVNGELRQKSNTKLMIQNVADAIEEVSRGITLKKGTVIATGTPGGVGMGMNPTGYMKSGDEVVCEIEKIGALRNVCE